MMRRTLRALSRCLAAAVPASAQMPPSIRKPIDAAKRVANKTSNQINEEQKAGNSEPGAKSAASRSRTPRRSATAASTQGPPRSPAAPTPPEARPCHAERHEGLGDVLSRNVLRMTTDGRRDPFLSLMATGDLRPMISDLTLVGIIYDESGRNSVAVLVDASARAARRIARRSATCSAG